MEGLLTNLKFAFFFALHGWVSQSLTFLSNVEKITHAKDYPCKSRTMLGLLVHEHAMGYNSKDQENNSLNYK